MDRIAQDGGQERIPVLAFPFANKPRIVKKFCQGGRPPPFRGNVILKRRLAIWLLISDVRYRLDTPPERVRKPIRNPSHTAVMPNNNEGNGTNRRLAAVL
ncbi:hypothetical protein CVT25_004290 [Psilocybe cyanescens]|uniref:Uncharacterized protein n=1 Tax=Psilocybe cyanescens TaxID=93625 RepID=A0A409WXK9_PSICY|nr:hypothetical protein CVT25_004290 [Psilocybe cyanescens]